MKKRWGLSFIIFPLSLSAALATVACNNKKVDQDLVGNPGDEPGVYIIDDKTKISKISKMLIEGISANDLVAGDTYEKAVEFISEYIKNEVNIEIEDINQKNTKLNKNENKIKVKISSGKETNTVEAKLIGVSSELSARIKSLSSRWDKTVNGEKLTTFNTIEDSSSIIFETIKNFDDQLTVELLKDSGSKKLEEGDNNIVIIFKLNDDEEEFKVNLQGVKISDLDYAAKAIEKLNVKDKITTETKDSVILSFINIKIKELANNGVQASEIKSINGDNNKLNDSGENEIIITLIDSKEQMQDSKIIFTNVNSFDPPHAIEQFKNLISESNIVFKLKINDTIENLKEQIYKNEILLEKYEYSVKWEIILADENDDVETDEPTIDKDGTRLDDKKTIEMRIKIKELMKAITIEYDVYENIE